MKSFYSLQRAAISALFLLLLAFSARGQAPGTIDLTFNPTDIGFNHGVGAQSDVNVSVVQPNGKILLGGQFLSYNGVNMGGLVRINPDGSLDPSFNPGGAGAPNGEVYSIALEANGKIIISGSFSDYNGITRKAIARLNANGTLDTSFNPPQMQWVSTGSGVGTIFSVAVQSNGKVLVGGDFIHPQKNLLRYNENGTLDTLFKTGAGPNEIVNKILLQTDGKILVAGGFTSINSTACGGIARLDSIGSVDQSFTSGTGTSLNGNAWGIRNMVEQPDGKLLISGGFDAYNGVSRGRIARLHSNGSLDLSFTPGTGFNEVVEDATLQADGKILAGGSFTAYNSMPCHRMARLNADGTFDPSFNPADFTISSRIYSMTQISGGRILAGGHFDSYPGTLHKYLICLQAGGSLDLNFNPDTGANDLVRGGAIQADGKVIISGRFIRFNGTFRKYLARLNADGTLDAGFATGAGPNNLVLGVYIQPDNKIVISGSFSTYDGVPRNGIARLNADGSLDTSFSPGSGPGGTSPYIYYTLGLPNGKLLVWGNFTSYNGAPIRKLARLNADGTLDAGFNTGNGFAATNTYVLSVLVQPDGKMLASGAFTTFNGLSHNRIVRLNSDGTLDASFNPGTGANGTIETMSLQADGKIFIGGQFSKFNEITRNCVARLNTDGSLDGSFASGAGPLINDSLSNKTIGTSVIQADGSILIGGMFKLQNNWVTTEYLARLTTDGTLDPVFNAGSGPNGQVYKLLLQSDGNIIIGGDFTSYNGTGRNRIARIFQGTSSTLATGALASPNLSRGATISVPFTASGTYNAGNNFKAQLSDQNGSFVNFTQIGSLTATSSGAITCTIPTAQAHGTAYRIRVVATSPVVTGTDNGTNLSLLLPPTTPGGITGKLSGVCINTSQTYSIAPVSGATNYDWVAPVGAGITSGQGTTTVTVNFYSNFTSGKLTVSASNSGCTSTARSATITSVLNAPTAISGINTGVCPGTVKSYSIAAVSGAASYTWITPAGASISSGQGSTSVTVSFSASFVSGNLSVKANNTCGSSPARSLGIRSTPLTPAAITGLASVCKNQASVTYSIAAVAGATSYTWTAPVGAVITAGQGTTSLTITYGATTGTMSLTVKASNGCGLSTARSLTVTVNSCAREMATAQEEPAAFEVFPNPSQGLFQISYSVGTNSTTQLQLFDVTGRLVKQQTLQALKGRNEASIAAGELPRGIYLLELSSEAGVQRQRVVLE